MAKPRNRFLKQPRHWCAVKGSLVRTVLLPCPEVSVSGVGQRGLLFTRALPCLTPQLSISFARRQVISDPSRDSTKDSTLALPPGERCRVLWR